VQAIPVSLAKSFTRLVKSPAHDGFGQLAEGFASLVKALLELVAEDYQMHRTANNRPVDPELVQRIKISPSTTPVFNKLLGQQRFRA